MDQMMIHEIKTILDKKTRNLRQDFDVLVSDVKEKLSNLELQLQSNELSSATSELELLAQTIQIQAEFISQDFCKVNEIQKLCKLIEDHISDQIRA